MGMQTLFLKLIIKTQVCKAMEERRDENLITNCDNNLSQTI